MAGLPDFSPQDRNRLKKLGLADAQIEQLRFARLHIRLVVNPPPARNDVIAILDDVEILAEKLLNKAAAISAQASAAHSAAHALIEQGYWQTRPDDHGAHSFHSIAPRLEALRDAARDGQKKLPTGPSRHRTANPQPVGAIEEALQSGWRKEHGSNVFSIQLVDGEEVKIYPNGPQRKTYPQSLRPSAADGSVFWEIVRICYRAEGFVPEPLAAMKSFLRQRRTSRNEARAALEAGIASANKRTRNRTSRKI